MAEDYGDLAEQYGPPDPGPSWNDVPKRKQPLDPTEGLEPQNFSIPPEAWDTESGPSQYRQEHPYQLYQTKQPAPQQAPPKLAPAIPLPFTQSDAIRLQKLQNGLAEAQRQVEAGEIDPQLGEHYKGQILPQYQELLQKQGQYKQQQQQEAMQQQMQQAAQQQALRQANASHWAQGFSDTVAQFTDPATGRHAFMAQEADGSWKELKFEDHNARQQLIQNEMAQPSVMAAPGATPGAEDSGSGTIGASAQAGEPSPLGSQPPQQAQQPQSLEDFVKETYQGPRVLNTAGEDITDRQRQAYDRTKATPRDELGRPTGPPPDEPGVKAHPYAEFLRRAERAIAKPNTQGLDPRQAANVMERWRDHVVGLAGHMLTQHDREEQHKRDYQTRTEENQRHEAAQRETAAAKKAADVAENKRKEEAKLAMTGSKGKELTVDQKSKILRGIRSDFEKENATSAKPLQGEEKEKAIQDRIRGHLEELGLKPKPEVNDQAKQAIGAIDEMVNRHMGAAQGMSDITPAQVSKLAETATKAYNETGMTSRVFGQASELGAMVKKILLPAHNEGRGLTKAEKAEYERLLGKIKDLPVAGQLGLQRPAEQPKAQAAPAEQPQEALPAVVEGRRQIRWTDLGKSEQDEVRARVRARGLKGVDDKDRRLFEEYMRVNGLQMLK